MTPNPFLHLFRRCPTLGAYYGPACTAPCCAEPPTVRVPAKCECGAEAAGCGPGHSSWCPKAVVS